MGYGRSPSEIAAWRAESDAMVNADRVRALEECDCKRPVSGGTYSGGVICKLCHRWFGTARRQVIRNRLRGYL